MDSSDRHIINNNSADDNETETETYAYTPAGYRGVYWIDGMFGAAVKTSFPSGNYEYWVSTDDDIEKNMSHAEEVAALLLLHNAHYNNTFMHSREDLEEYSGTSEDVFDWSRVARFVQECSGRVYVLQHIDCGRKTLQCVPVELLEPRDAVGAPAA